MDRTVYFKEWTQYKLRGLLCWLIGKESACQCKISRFDPWVGKISWRRKWQPTPVFLPGKSHGQRSLAGYSPGVAKSQIQLRDYSNKKQAMSLVNKLKITYQYGVFLESEVKWALGNITMSKASGGDGIPAELFQILKDDGVKVLHSICQQIWKTQQWP